MPKAYTSHLAVGRRFLRHSDAWYGDGAPDDDDAAAAAADADPQGLAPGPGI